MTKLGPRNVKKIAEPVYYCDKHGVLNRSALTKSKASGAMKHSEWLRSD